MIKHPLIAVTTDFGISDPYAGIMKGVILSINAGARLVDLCADVSPCCVAEAAFALFSAYSFFPPGTIHLVVVDPGVGTKRAVLVAYAGGQYFVAPDNGVLAHVLDKEQKASLYLAQNREFFLSPISDTFHGRDVFAPLAAWLSRGVSPDRFGPPAPSYTKLPPLEPERTKQGWAGRVIYVDRFGNLVTNLTRECLQQAGAFCLHIGAAKISRLAANYQETTGEGELFMLFGGTGRLEVSLSRQSAARVLDIGAGEKVFITYSGHVER